jgi:hypothetical protein
MSADDGSLEQPDNRPIVESSAESFGTNILDIAYQRGYVAGVVEGRRLEKQEWEAAYVRGDVVPNTTEHSVVCCTCGIHYPSGTIHFCTTIQANLK